MKNIGSISPKIFVSVILGNLLEHYDNALYGFLVPTIFSPLFFPSADPINGIIIAYALIPLGILAKPLGGLILGKVGDLQGRKVLLFWSISGMGIVTFLIGLLPTYREIGVWAPILLALCKFFQQFFIAAESTGGSIFLLEHTQHSKHNWVASWYSASTILGILLASTVAAYIASRENALTEWRWAFLVAGLTALLSIYMRYQIPESLSEKKEQITKKSANTPIWRGIIQHRRNLICLMIMSGLTYATYSMSFLLLTAITPLVTTIHASEILAWNIPLLCFDMVLMPIFGKLSDRYTSAKIMSMMAITLAIITTPLFYFLSGNTMLFAISIRIVIIILGVGFSIPFQAYIQNLFPAEWRCRLNSLGYSIGSQLIGATLPSISLWLYKIHKSLFIPGCYFSLIAFAAWFALRKAKPLTVEDKK